MNAKYDDFLYVFHTTQLMQTNIKKQLDSSNLTNYEIISDDKIKSHILEKSVFAVAKSGTISLEICNKKVPSIIIYKMNLINFFIIKSLVKIKYANIINIAANKMIIPELLQSNCNSKQIFLKVSDFIENQSLIDKQIKETEKILDNFKTKNSPSEAAAASLGKFIFL